MYENQINKMYARVESSLEINHDIRHHLTCIYGLVKAGSNDSCIQYLNQLLQYTNITNYYANSGNPCIDSIINYKLQKVDTTKVQVVVMIDIHNKIHIDRLDLSIVLGNLIDNAVEAILECKGEAILRLKVICRDEKFYVEILNTFDGNLERIGTKITTRKKDKKQHGRGLNQIEKLVTKYNGFHQFKIDETIFSSTVYLDNKLEHAICE